ncbi:TPA: NAAT family transporter [Vibrio cholerae]|nr:NAAT family transporter [Vibrio cholerae]HCZ9627974.1 NAAT family transporter [Vibrio cholerae]HCZ9657008.1 NAAT family transporter [Vibrio cholerae]
MQSFEIAIFLQFFLGLVAAVNPVGIMPVFVSLTGHMTLEEKNKTAATANIAVAIILIIAFSMMSGKLGEDKQNKQEKSEYISREQIAVVPLAMPLMAGPGAISSTIVYGSRYPNMLDTLGIILTVVAFSFCSWLLFRSAPYIVRLLGQTGINVITRIMGLILGALGIEFIANGLRNLFPGLA